MLKKIFIPIVAGVGVALFIFHLSFGGDKNVFDLPNNDSSKYFTYSGGHPAGVEYMDVLNSVSLDGVDKKATTAILTTTLDDKGTTDINFHKNTYTITAGYTSCKVKDYVDRKELPKTIKVDLTNLECFNHEGTVNLLPEIKEGARMNVFFAKNNGITKNTQVYIK